MEALKYCHYYQQVSVFSTLAYEMSTLPKDSSGNKGSKITSLKCPAAPKPDILESVKGDAGDSSRNFKATQTEITMDSIIWGTVEGSEPLEKGVDL